VIRSGLALIAAVVLATACTTTPEERIEAACTVLCGCQAGPLPGLQRECIKQCEGGASGQTITEQCADCITTNSDQCTTIENVCRPVCNPPQPVFASETP